MTSECGAARQLEKFEKLECAEFLFHSHVGSEDAWRDVYRQIKRCRQLETGDTQRLQVYGTSAAHFNDAGANAGYANFVDQINRDFATGWKPRQQGPTSWRKSDLPNDVLPTGCQNFLAEISKACRV